MTNLPQVSIIIPCFNQGIYLSDCLDSIFSQEYQSIEIIVVNDGSTEAETLACLDKINDERILLINTVNNGLPEARNIGIRASKGKYILPLDADDKISKCYISLAISCFQSNPGLLLVYGKAEYFGERSGEWKLEKFDLQRMILYNQIYPSGIFKKEDYDKTTGYDSGMKYGWEDWDFWLSLISLGGEVHQLETVCFFYRVRSNSMVNSMTDEQKIFLRQRVYLRHSQLYSELFDDPISLYYNYKYHKNLTERLLSNKLIKFWVLLKNKLRKT